MRFSFVKGLLAALVITVVLFLPVVSARADAYPGPGRVGISACSIELSAADLTPLGLGAY